MTDNTRSALLMMAAVAGFTINDAFLKALLDEVSVFQALALRGVMTTTVLILIAHRLGALQIPATAADRRNVVFRGLCEMGGVFFFMTALVHMPLANATAIIQSQPLALTLAGALFLGESLGWRRLSAILIGFIGVMLIVRPGTDGFTIHSIYLLATVACVTARDIFTRKISRGVPSMTVAAVTSAVITLFGLAGSLTGDWRPMSSSASLQLLGSTAFVMVGYVCSVMMMRVGEVSFFAPFRYTSLIWALVLGLVVFGDWPDPMTLLGAAIVVATGLFTLWRERRRSIAAATRASR